MYCFYLAVSHPCRGIACENSGICLADVYSNTGRCVCANGYSGKNCSTGKIIIKRKITHAGKRLLSSLILFGFAWNYLWAFTKRVIRYILTVPQLYIFIGTSLHCSFQSCLQTGTYPELRMPPTHPLMHLTSTVTVLYRWSHSVLRCHRAVLLYPITENQTKSKLDKYK